jgi:hypothetical protein
LRDTDAYVEQIRTAHAEGNSIDLALLLSHPIPDSGKPARS